jgi:high-affinity nickel permease
MFGVLSLGFLLGMQHALEADHIAAVSSIAARRIRANRWRFA